MVLLGFFTGFAGVVIRSKPDATLQLLGNGVAVISIGLVVVGCVMSIAGRSKRKAR